MARIVVDHTDNWQANLFACRLRPSPAFPSEQTRIAGLIVHCTDEALSRTRLDRWRIARRVTPAEARRLHKAIVGVLGTALECCLHPAPDFRDPSWWFKSSERIPGAYGREGLRCRRCRSTVRRIEQCGRSTFFVPDARGRGPGGAEQEMNQSSSKKSDAARKPEFERLLTRLQEVVRKLENANVSLDDALKLFEEGVELSRECQRQLEDAEGKVEVLLKRAGGKTVAEPFEPEGHGDTDETR
jgi:exodeoxyribonuclease VII small subunit